MFSLNYENTQTPFQYENNSKTINYSLNNIYNTNLQNLDKIDINKFHTLDKSLPLENINFHPLNESNYLVPNNNLNLEDPKFYQECEEIKEKRQKLTEVYYSLQDFKKMLLNKEKELKQKEAQLKEFESNLKNNENILKNNINNFENYIRNKRNELNSQVSEIDIIQSQKEKELKTREEKILEYFRIYNLQDEYEQFNSENNYNNENYCNNIDKTENLNENISNINNNELNINTTDFVDFVDNTNNTFKSGNNNNDYNDDYTEGTMFKQERTLNELDLNQIDYTINSRIKNTYSSSDQNNIAININK